MNEAASTRPAICLNMIVRNEAHIVCEGLDTVAPYIASWVIVDTGSADGTQDVIREHMARLGVPGVLHERPWRNFGVNRTEALELAQGHADYILVMDADDLMVGTPDFGGLDADTYALRCRQGPAVTYWRKHLFRDGMPWRYVGVLHEYADCDEAFIEERLDGDYHIESRRLGARSLDPKKYERDRDVLLAEVKRNPDDARSVFYLAQSCFDQQDFAAARRWYARRAQMTGWDEETYCAKFRVAEAMALLEEPWPDVQDAYLQAWEFRPTRAEPLHAIAYHYRAEARYRLGYVFAAQAAQIPMPDDILFVGADVYNWRAVDEQAVCASQTGRHAEAFGLCRQLLARDDLADGDRLRIAGNRDFSVPDMLAQAEDYPDALARSFVAGQRGADVTVSLVAGADRGVTERTMNSFLNCCTDLQRITRFLIVADGLTQDDHDELGRKYPFLEFLAASTEVELYLQLSHIREAVDGRFWLHLDQGWRFFAPESLATRLSGVLDAEPDVVQVGVNLHDASSLTGASAAEDITRRSPAAGRYVLADSVAYGPAMFDTARLDKALSSSRLQTATLDEVLCVRDL